MKIKIYVFAIFIALLGCTKGFEELQKNPNLPEEVNPGLLLPSIIFPAVNAHLYGSREISHELMQYTSNNNSFTQVQRFIFTLGNSNSVWNGFYGRIGDISVMQNLAKELGDVNYEAIAIIMKSWSFSILTDVFIDVPYSEAGKGVDESNFTPIYDTQQTIYEKILLDLEKANEMLEPSKGLTYGGDILFGGDVLRWKKFANSLRLRLLMRVSFKPEANAASKIKDLVENPSINPLFESNEDHAVYQYSGVLPDVFPYSTQREFDFNGYVSSEFMIETLKGLNDPRLSVFYQPTKNSIAAGSPEYVGLPSGLPAGDSFEYNGGRDGQSLLNNNNFLLDATQKGIIMTYSEVQFLLAEAAMRGMIDGEAQAYYENGVTSSMEYWGTSVPEGYLSSGDAAWDGKEETLFLQKYLALFWGGFEAWFDYRRTGFPNISPGPANVNDDQIPVRLIYPTIEQSLNEAHYNEAAIRIGGDNINSKGWWESF